MRKMQENTDRILGFTSEEIINECMVLRRRIHRAGSAVRPARRPDHHLLQGLKAAALDLRLSRASQTHPPTPASRPHRSRHGPQRRDLFLGCHGHSVARRDRRHNSHLAHAAPRWRPPRRGVCLLRTAPSPRRKVLPAQRDRLPRLGGRTTATPFSTKPRASRATYATKCPNGSINMRVSNP